MATLTQATMTYERSRTIPLPKSHIPRTNSELQFNEDTVAAEFRDMCMFHRLVSGIHEKSLEYKRNGPLPTDREYIDRQTRGTIEKIIQRRNEHITPTSIAPNFLINDDCNRKTRRGSRLLYIQQVDDQYGFFSDLATEKGKEDDNLGSEGEVFDLDL